MKNLINTSIKASNFKCFSTEAQGFEHIKPINIIVGKNNSGKSSLLETIQRLVTVNFKFGIDDLNKSTPSGAKPAFYITVPLDEEHITSVFSKTASGGSIPGRSHFDYGKQLIGLNITFAINDNSSNVYDVHIEGEDDITPPLNTIRNHNAYRTNLATRIHNPLNNFYYRRLSSERDIKLEQNNDGLTLNINGDGATNIIQNYINRSDLNRDIITKDILSGLNEIFKPDSYFTEITSRKGDGDFWQIYLSEKDKTLVPLINSGSGLKTILLVLLNIHVAPIIDKKPLKNYIFAFEELENNLHPALLRNLLKYLYTTHKENGCLFFLTTHSNVTIDVFSKNEDAQIIHVTHDRKNAQCDTATTYIHNKGILDDLDVRASDLLQSNCVVWVEGPSDRIYLNKWISLWTDSKLQEGIHYQCVFYGGRLLSHLNAEDPTEANETIPILRLSRHAIILIDSDKKKNTTYLNNTKKRIKDEIKTIGGLDWVTKGREIENYIPSKAVDSFFDKRNTPQVAQFGNFFEHIENIKKNTGSKFINKKTVFAEEISNHFTKENLKDVLDLKVKLDEVCLYISQCNSINLD